MLADSKPVPIGSYDPISDVLLWFNHTPVFFHGKHLSGGYAFKRLNIFAV